MSLRDIPTSRQQIITSGKYRVVALRYPETQLLYANTYVIEEATEDALGEIGWRTIRHISSREDKHMDLLDEFLFTLFLDIHEGTT